MKGDDSMKKWLKVGVSTVGFVASIFAMGFSANFLVDSIFDVTIEKEEA